MKNTVRRVTVFVKIAEALSNILLGEKIPLDVKNGETDEIIIPANRKILNTSSSPGCGVQAH